jgi:phenylacetate-coenzyme A ligase PaaK-like adenylate-forming protein
MTTATISSSSSQADRLRALVAEQLSRDRWSRDHLLAYQRERLHALLGHAVTASPYYRQVLGPDIASRQVALAELPTATLMDNFDRVVTDPRLRRAALEAHVVGPDPAQPLLGRYRVFATSGTTGLRGLFVYSAEEFASWIATCVRGLTWWGVTPATRMLGIGSPSPLHITQQVYVALLAGQSSAPPRLTVTTPLPEMVAALNAYQPQTLIAYASIAAQLAEEQLLGRLRITPTVVGTSSEVLTIDMRRRIRDAWNLEPFDVYGTTEATIPAASRPGQVGMDILEDLVILEVVDQDNQPVPAGTPGHKVLLTNLVNYAQPLIRYELSDAVTIAEGSNPLGLPYARIAAIDGRSDDILTLPTPDGGQIAVHPFHLRAPFATLPEVVQYQIRHDHTGLHVSLILRPTAPPDTTARVRHALTRQLQAAGAIPPAIEVTPVDEIRREGGHGAKLKLIQAIESQGEATTG